MKKSNRVLISGSSGGLGFQIAKTLQENGCQIVLNGRDRNKLDRAALQLGNCPYVVGDISVPEGAKQVIIESKNILGGLDCLVCNVGSGRSVPPGMETAEEWHRVFNINFWSTVHLVSAAENELELTQGAVVCISSICGVEVISGAPITYSVAKAALNSYIRGISRPLAKKGIRINGIAPGNLMFQGSVWEIKKQENPERVEKMLQDDVPLGCFGTGEEIGRVAYHLGFDQSMFTTGSIWVVDGGQTRAF